MIAYLNGIFAVKNPAYIIVECNGVGYHVHISLNTFSKIQHLQSGRLYTYMHVREDAQMLYGFADEAEKNLFIHLIAVNGIGPNTARMMLSSMSVKDIEQAIITENDVLIQKIKGVGPKTAKRLVIELKDVISKTASGGEISSPNAYNTIKDEALSALAMLGFSRQMSEKAISTAMKTEENSSTVEALVKAALKNL
jgi:holliday junction DNA helicase RuvA